MTDLPWAAMLKIAGVRVTEVAEATGLTPSCVQKQLRGARTLQYNVRRECERLIRERRGQWYPGVRELIRTLAGKE